MFYTQFNKAVCSKEKAGNVTLVDELPVKPMAERILQQMMGGLLVESNRIGYDFNADDAIPESIRVGDFRSLDITEKIAVFDDIKERISIYKQTVRETAKKKLDEINEKKELDKIAKEYDNKAREVSLGETETIKERKV